jgi:5-methylcytosine-specific restriction protein A
MATITTEARTVLARLELLQHGTTTRYDPAKGSRNSEAPLVPPGESDPPHERWRRAMDAAPEEGLALVVQRATDELSASLRRPLAPITPDTMGELKDRILACDGFAPREIAYALRCAERLVRVRPVGTRTRGAPSSRVMALTAPTKRVPLSPRACPTARPPPSSGWPTRRSRGGWTERQDGARTRLHPFGAVACRTTGRESYALGSVWALPVLSTWPSRTGRPEVRPPLVVPVAVPGPPPRPGGPGTAPNQWNNNMALTVCMQPGCPALVAHRWCERHRRLSPRLKGYGSAWERTRRRFLAGHPRCARCPAPAVHVHHVDGRGPLGPRGHDPANLLALCQSCHNRQTALDRAAVLPTRPCS